MPIKIDYCLYVNLTISFDIKFEWNLNEIFEKYEEEKENIEKILKYLEWSNIDIDDYVIDWDNWFIEPYFNICFTTKKQRNKRKKEIEEFLNTSIEEIEENNKNFAICYSIEEWLQNYDTWFNLY